MQKNFLIFAGLLVLVVAAAYFYSQSVRSTPIVSTPGLVELNPDIALAELAFEEGKLDRAEELFRGIPSSDPGFVRAGRALVMVLLQKDDKPGALEVLDKLVTVTSDQPAALAAIRLDQSGVHFRMGQFAEAEFAATRAMAADPDDPTAAYKIALYQIAQGELATGIDSYHTAIQSKGSMENVEKALSELLVLHEQHPEIPGVHYAVAFLAKTLERPLLEIEELEHFLKLEPDGPASPGARENLDNAMKALTTP